jgi:uncharacterized protein YaiL (DUF2058 family)
MSIPRRTSDTPTIVTTVSVEIREPDEVSNTKPKPATVRSRQKSVVPPSFTGANGKAGTAPQTTSMPALTAAPKPKSSPAEAKARQAKAAGLVRNNQIRDTVRACLPKSLRTTPPGNRLSKLQTLSAGTVSEQDKQEWTSLAKGSAAFQKHGQQVELIAGYATGLLACREAMRTNPEKWKTNLHDQLPVDVRMSFVQFKRGDKERGAWLENMIEARVLFDQLQNPPAGVDADTAKNLYVDHLQEYALSEREVGLHDCNSLTQAYGHLLAWQNAIQAGFN